jgi:acyl-CoA synthetase (AMP-forming)/AMP-acid ligase II
MTSHRTWAFRIAEVMSRLAHPRPVHLVAAPMTHGAGAGALELMAMGATHVILPSFDAGAVIEAIGRHGVTHLFLPPTALYRLMAHPMASRGNYASLRYLMCGGAPIAPERLREALRLFGPALHVGYGGTEFGGGLCWMPGALLLDSIARGQEQRLLSCGLPSPLIRVDVVGEDGARLPPGEAGEIVIRGHTLASGYYKDPEETARAFRSDGFHTGDVGYRDADGFVYISDRKKDMIISGGFNIYPSEIESVLLGHPGVHECAVVGVPDAEWGEAVKAVVELKQGATADAAALERLCRKALAGYKVPKSFEFWREIPRSPAGKVLKRAVRTHFRQDRT